MVTLSTDKWKIEGIKGVLFDKDGTLLDSHVYWGRIIHRRANAIIKKYNMSLYTYSDICFAMGYDVFSRKLISEGPIALVSRDQVINILMSYLLSIKVDATFTELDNIFNEEHELFNEEIDNYTVLLPGVLDFLTTLYTHNVKISVVTSDTVKNTISFLNKFNITKMFENIIGKDTCTEPKISGIPATLAIEEFKLNALEVISIGDAPMDLIMANKAAMLAGVGICTGQVPLSTLSEYSSFITNSLKDIKVI